MFPLWQTHIQAQYSRIVRRSQATDRIPPSDGREPISLAPRVRARGNIVQHLRVSVQCWVDEPNRSLSDRNALLVDSVNDCGEYWGRCASSAN